MSDATGGPDSYDADAPEGPSEPATTSGAMTATNPRLPPPPPPTDRPPPNPAERAQPDVRWPRVVRPPSSLKPAWVAAVVLAALLTDLALRRVPWDQAATSLLIAAIALGLAVSGFVTSRSARIMLVLATFFGAFLTWRTGFLLSAFNLLAAVGLLTAAAAFGRRGDIWNAGPGRLIAAAVAVLEGMLFVPVGGIEEAEARYHAWNREGNETARAVVRGVAIAGPTVLVLGLLLASADVVFESFFTGYDLRLGTLLGHLILMAVGAGAMTVLLRVASRRAEPRITGPGWSLGVVEVSILLGSITALFAVFAYAQLVTVMGGADEALSRAGLDPKQFARQGFFQLLWVAAITLAVVMIVRVLADRSDGARRVATTLGLVTVALTLVIVTVAMARIAFYVDDSGLTARRLYAAVISAWIAISFVLVAARLLGLRRDRAWLTPASVLSAVVLLLVLNLANPQRRIAENNLARNEDVLVWHVRHDQFVGEGRAELADNLDRLSPDLAVEVRGELCARYRHDGADDDGWLSFNAGRTRAADAIGRLCG